MSRSIELNDLEEAINEAYRFLESARRLKARIVERGEYWVSGKDNADTFRKSMDLTRSLSQLRKRK